MAGLANPVPGLIQANGEAWDGKSFRVTSTFDQHVSQGRPAGIDFGNGRCGADVYALAAGTVASVNRDPNGALIVRVKHAGLHSSGYAHLSMALVTAGAVVKRGQRLGLVGKTGASACHLHAGYVIGGREIDFWPLLEQNQEAPVSETIVIHTPFPEGTRSWRAAGGQTVGYKPSGATRSVTLTAGSSAPASGTATITQNPLKAPNGAGFVLLVAGALEGYYVLRTAGTVDPAPPAKSYEQGYNDGLAAAEDAVEELPEA